MRWRFGPLHLIFKLPKTKQNKKNKKQKKTNKKKQTKKEQKEKQIKKHKNTKKRVFQLLGKISFFGGVWKKCRI